MRKFQVGGFYSVRSIGDHNCIWRYVVLARTACTVTLRDESGKTLKLRINKRTSEYRGAESVYPLGNYSMCPILSA